MRFLFFFFLLGLSTSVFSQTVSDSTQTAAPQFPGGDMAYRAFLALNLQYPSEAQVRGIEGPVILQFTVNEKGLISTPTVLKGLGGGCTEEALRLLSVMPVWVPAQKRGQPIAQKHILAISFKLPHAPKLRLPSGHF